MKTKRTTAFVIGYADGDHVIYPGGEVVYENDTIIFVGHGYPDPVDRTIDAGLAIISPGFIVIDALADIDHAILDCWNSSDVDRGLYVTERYFATGRRDVFTPDTTGELSLSKPGCCRSRENAVLVGTSARRR